MNLWLYFVMDILKSALVCTLAVTSIVDSFFTAGLSASASFNPCISNKVSLPAAFNNAMPSYKILKMKLWIWVLFLLQNHKLAQNLMCTVNTFEKS